MNEPLPIRDHVTDAEAPAPSHVTALPDPAAQTETWQRIGDLAKRIVAAKAEAGK